MKDNNVLEEIDKAISAEDWDTSFDLRDKAILFILDSTVGEDGHDQIWVLHQIQSVIYDKM